MDVTVEETFADIVHRHADMAPDAPALLGDGQDPLTYGALARQMDRIGERLNGLGFGRGDRIATIGPNDAATAALVTGIWSCAAAVPMNPALSAGEFAIYLRDLKVQAIAVVDGTESAAAAVARDIGLPVLAVGRTSDSVAGMIDIRPEAGGGKAERPGRAQAEDLALVLLTSGTTSHSKVVPVTNSQLAAKIGWEREAYNLTPDDRCLNLMPLFHGHAMYSTLGGTLGSGGSLFTLSEFSPAAFFRLIRELGPTWYSGAYTFHHRIRAAAADHAEVVEAARLRFVRTASGHLDARVADELAALFRAPVIATYSSTELGGISSTPFPPMRQKLDTAGLPHGGATAVMTPDGRLLPSGENGEIVVRSARTFTGYENDLEETARCFVDGWFRTGDEGFLDADGYLTLTGRIKDIINRGGEKITPSEVDAALMAHPDIVLAVTFPIPHATLGQEVAAAVVPEKGAEMTDETLTQFLRGRLAAFKIPRRFIFVESIPRGPSGKVQRRSLADAFGLVSDSLAGLGDRIADDRVPTALEAKLQRIWAEVLGLDRVGLYEDFFMLGGDSLQAVDLFLRVEKEIGRRLPRSVLFEAGTVEKMARRIGEVLPSSCLVPVQPEGARPPFFCIHDGKGHILNSRQLSRLVGVDGQPFYGIQARGLDGEEEPFTRIEDMAAHYIKEIKKVQAEGPYYLGGYSFGGRVAYVMAQQLRAAGEEVGLLALIDTYSAYGRQTRETGDWLKHHWQRMRELPLRKVPGYLWFRLRNLQNMIYMKLRLKSYAAAWRFYRSRGKPLPRFLWRPVPANDMIRAAYRPQPYDGDATLFKGKLFSWSHEDQHEGWTKLIRGKLTIRPIPAYHYEIMHLPHVRTLAVELTDALRKAQAAYEKPLRRLG